MALEGVSTSENRLSDSLCAKRRRASDWGFHQGKILSDTFLLRIEWDLKLSVLLPDDVRA